MTMFFPCEGSSLLKRLDEGRAMSTWSHWRCNEPWVSSLGRSIPDNSKVVFESFWSFGLDGDRAPADLLKLHIIGVGNRE